MKTRYFQYSAILATALILLVLFQNCGKGFEVSSELASSLQGATGAGAANPPAAPTPAPTGPVELDLAKQSGVVAAWRFDQVNGVRTRDASNNNFDGTITGGATAVQGKFGNALSFNGTNYVDIGQPPALNFDHNQAATSYTISAWIRTTSFGSLVAKRGAVFGNIQYQMFIFTDGRIGAHVGGETQLISGGPVINDGLWHHVVMTVYRENQMPFVELFVDEVSVVKQVIQETTINNENIWIGSRPGGFAYTGLIDEVVIINRQLSPAELRALY